MDISNQTGIFSPHQGAETENFGTIAFTTSTPSNPTRRSGRKSWFDNFGNTGKGTKYEIAVEKTVKTRSASRRKSEEDEVETLILTHFTNPPRIGFGIAKPGITKRRSLLIKNPHEYPQDVKVEKFPFKKHFDIDKTKFTVEAEDTLVLTITWSPEEEGNFREMILLQVDGSYRLQAFVFGCVEKPAPKKKVRKGLLGRATKKPFAIIQTPNLANIAKSYSPTKGARRSGDGTRRLSKGRENKAPIKKTQAKKQGDFDLKEKQALIPNEEKSECLDSNIRLSHITPIKPAEETTVSAEFVVPKVVKMPGKSSVKKLKDDYEEELESLSPLVAKYLDNSDEDVIVVRQTINTEDQANQLNTPDRMSKNLDTPIRVLSKKRQTPVSVTITQEGKLPQCNLNTPDRISLGIAKTPEKEKQSFDPEPKIDALSPNSFLQDSLCSQRGLDTSLFDAGSTMSRQPAHSTILPTPERMSRAVGQPVKDFISPNKFLKELNDTQEKLELSFQQEDPNTIPSPESILNSSIPHSIMVKQLQTVKMSLGTPNFAFSPKPLDNKRETFVLKSNFNTNKSPALRRDTFIKKKTAVAPKTLSSNPKSGMMKRQGVIKSTKIDRKSNDVPMVKKARKGTKENLCTNPSVPSRISEDSIDGGILGSPIPTQLSSASISRKAINTPELQVNSNAEFMVDSVRTAERRRSTGKRLTTPGEAVSPAYKSQKSVFESPGNLTVFDTPTAAVQLQHKISSDFANNNNDRMSKDSLDESIPAVNSSTVTKEKPLNNSSHEHQTSGKKLFSKEIGESSLHDSGSFQSPSNLPDDTPTRELFTRRATLTVIKQQPSDALLQVTQRSSQMILEDIDDKVHSNDSPRLHTLLPDENPERCVSVLLKNSATAHSLGQTPTDVSVNKTSSFTKTPHQLPTSPNPDHSRRSTHVVEKPKVLDMSIIGRKRLFPPLEDPDIESVNQTDSLTTEAVATCTTPVEEVNSENFAGDNPDKAPLDVENIPLLKKGKEEKSQNDPNIEAVTMKPKSLKSAVAGIGAEKEKQQSTEKIVTGSQERKPYVAFISGSPVNPNVEKPTLTNRKKELVKKRTHSENRAVTEASNKRLRCTASIQTDVSGKVTSYQPTAATKPKMACTTKGDTKTGTSVKPTNKTKSAVKGLAQTKLILMKKTRPTALPKHPMPFASKNMYYDERWIDKQERGFVHWLNFVLTPAEEYQHSDKKVKVDAGALSVEASRTSVKLAPSKEVLSIRAYTARRRLNQLRRSACNLFQTKEIVHVIQKLEAEIESLRLVVRKDKKVHADLGMKQNILDMILSFNPLWLRIGLETVYGEMIPMQNNSDVIGMSRFIVTRLLSNPDIAAQYCHPTVPHLYRDGYAEAIAQHLLKKFFMLIFFLDQAKSRRLINHDPCLFCKDSEFKSMKAMLIEFSRNYLSGEGDVTKHLGYLGYIVTHQQTSMDEFDYAVSNLATDLRDGVRLTRVLELLINRWDLSKSLRAPAISRLQKVHNMEVVFKALSAQGVTFGKEKKITTKDIVDGHREKTLHVLWALILQYQVDVLLNKEQLKEEISILQKSLRVRNQLAALQRYEQGLSKKRRESAEQDLHLQSESLLLLLRWCRTVCAFYNIKVENFTVSFGDGRAMCALVHHYHPSLLPWNAINKKTTMTYQADLEEEMCNRNLDLNSSEVFSPAPFPVAEDPVLFENFLSNEKANFKLLYEKVSELGGIPLMLRSMDMSNTIPDEKVVVTYICYLCSRLLDIRHESRAARVIQLAWRRHYLRRSKKELQLKHDAAVIIQKAVRNFLRARQAVRKEKGVRVIQKYVRSWLARQIVAKLKAAKELEHLTNAACILQGTIRKWLEKRMAVRKAAATRIQATWRCHIQRQKYKKVQYACIILQSQTRMYIQKSAFLKIRKAVICIQHQYRAHCSMVQHRGDFLQIRSAAITLQSKYKGLRQRKKFLQLRASVVEIQSTARMWIERKKYLTLHSAAVSIQRHYRARLETAETRKKFLVKKGAAITIQAWFRGHQAREHVRCLNAAAVIIQSRFKGFQEHRKYLKIKSAVIVLQRWKRAVTQGRLARSEFKKVRTSVVQIQSAYRGHRARSDFLKKRSAAITIQSHIRCRQEMIAYTKARTAVTILQRWFRASKEGEKVRREFLVQKGAAMTIQAFYRGFRVRQQIKHLHSAATKIEATFKGHLQRKRFLQERKAVIVIQRQFTARLEGRRVRREYLIQRGAALTIQAHFRGHMARNIIKHLHAAAVIIQSRFKGFQEHKKYLKIKSAVIVLQRWKRAVTQGRLARSEFKKVRTSVVQIQSAYRGHRARSDFLKKRSAAITIQSHIRCRQEMIAYTKVRTAVTILQRWFRASKEGEKVRREFLVQKGAAMTIQAFYRGFRVRQQIKLLHSAATKIEATFKGHLQRKRFLQERKVVIVIQRQFTARLEGRRVRREYLIQRGAALTIQAHFRGHHVRQDLAAQHLAAQRIQSKVKGYLQRKSYLRLKAAALVIQRRWTSHLLGQHLRREFLVKKGAAMTMQAAFRGYNVRKTITMCHKAAVVIQSRYRSHRATLSYQKLRTASICIQRWYKNLLFTRQIKADYQCNRAAAITIQSWYRCRRAVQNLNRDRIHVVMSQAIVRRFLQRRRFLKLRRAALVIQQRFVARRQCISMRRKFLIQKGAAMTIQAVFRGHLVRQDLRRKHAAAVLIQSHYRTHLAVSSYGRHRQAVTAIQSWYRNCLFTKRVRLEYLRIKDAAVVIQKHYRSFLARRSYLRDLSNIILIQTLVRGMLQRIAYRRLQWAAVVCQTRYRAMVASHQQQCQYNKLRSAAIILQSAWRRRTAQVMYNKTKWATILLQSHVRMVQNHKQFCQLKAAAIHCQRLVRSKRQMQNCRRDYLIRLGAIITIQALIKSYLVQKQFHSTCKSVIYVQACVRRFLAQRQYRSIYNATVAIQRRFRANLATKRQRSTFLNQCQAAKVIQTNFRKAQARRHLQKVQSSIVIQKTLRMFLVRQDFLKQRNAAIVLQSQYRAFLVRKETAHRKQALKCIQRTIKMFLFRKKLCHWMQKRNEAATKIQCCYRSYQARHREMRSNAAMTIQSLYRMYAQRKIYRHMIQCIIHLQSRLRGALARRKMQHVRKQHSAATCIQTAYRSFKRRQAEKELRRKREQYLEKFSSVVSAQLSVIKIQRCYRNHRVLLLAQQRLHSIITIQRWMRAKLARKRYSRFVSAIRVVQAKARQHLRHREEAVIRLQAVIRGWLGRRHVIRREQHIIKLQSIWRGRKVRKAYKSKKLETIRNNLKEATKTATDDKKLGNRTESALDYLLKYKQLSHILEALIHLETSTRLSPACCQRMVNVNAVGVIYRLIQSCNRSQPHMEIIRYSINILLNLAKYEKTRSAVYEVEGAIECLLELMQVYREKGHIFSCSCTLMGILGMVEDKRQVILTDKKVVGKLQSLYTLTARKHKITETRMIRQAKISAAKSFNATLPILASQKKQHRIHPAWVLQRNQMRHIEDPLQAIKFVLDNYHLSPK